MPAEDPSVAVGNAGSGKPALKSRVGEPSEVSVQEFDLAVKAAYIVLSAMDVKSDEVTGKFIAEPISSLRLDVPMFPEPVVNRPSVETDRDVDRPFGRDTQLYAYVGAEQRISDEVGFYCYILSETH